MKLHKLNCQAVAEALVEIFVMKKHAPQVVEKFLLTQKKWGARDRNFFASQVYETVRYYRLYCRAVSLAEITNLKEAWFVVGATLIHKKIPLPDWEELRYLDVVAIETKIASASFVERESIPDWLDEMGRTQLGEIWEAEIAAQNIPAKICLRVNTLRSYKMKVINFLEANEIAFSEVPFCGDAIVIETRKNIRLLPIYQAGEVEIQDVSSQLVAPALQLKKGMRVADVCAGAGGKSLHIAALLQNEGEVYSFDIQNPKLDELEKRKRRAGAHIVHTYLPQPALLKNLEGYFDRVLIDAPCSGLGTLRRNPDAKWKLTPAFVQQMVDTQHSVLKKYVPLLKTNGLLVYATCSILPIENRLQVDRFIAAHPNFEIIDEQQIFAHQSGFDGFYTCTLQRKH